VNLKLYLTQNYKTLNLKIFFIYVILSNVQLMFTFTLQ